MFKQWFVLEISYLNLLKESLHDPLFRFRSMGVFTPISINQLLKKVLTTNSTHSCCKFHETCRRFLDTGNNITQETSKTMHCLKSSSHINLHWKMLTATSALWIYHAIFWMTPFSIMKTMGICTTKSSNHFTVSNLFQS